MSKLIFSITTAIEIKSFLNKIRNVYLFPVKKELKIKIFSKITKQYYLLYRQRR